MSDIKGNTNASPLATKPPFPVKKLFIRAIKLPLMFFALGLGLMGLNFLEGHIPKDLWLNTVSVLANQDSSFLTLGLFFTVYNFISLVCYEYEKHLLGKSNIVAALVISTLRKGLRIIFFLILINLMVNLVGLKSFSLEVVNKVIDAITICFVGWLMLQILSVTETAYYKYGVISNTRDRRKKAIYTKLHIIKGIVTVIIFVLTIASVFMLFDRVRNLGISLLASAGFLTALIGLAAQRTLGSLFAGLQLALSQSIKIDDMVVIEGEQGTIEDISLSQVTLKLWDLRRLILPTHYFIDRPFQNWSRGDGTLLGAVYLYVDFHFPIKALREELNRLVKEAPWWDKKTCSLLVTDTKDNHMELRIVFGATSPEIVFEARAQLREKLLEFIRLHHGQYFPKQRTLALSEQIQPKQPLG